MFENFKGHPVLGGNIAVLDIYNEVARGNIIKAREAMREAKFCWQDQRLNQDLDHLCEILEKQDGSTEP